MIPSGDLLPRVGAHVAAVAWERLDPRVRARAPLILLDAFGCGFVGARLAFHQSFVNDLVTAGGADEATLWADGRKLPAAHAALANGTFAHHVEMDDGNSRASLHGGVTVIPAALAIAELTGATGQAFLEAVVAGYDAAIAIGRVVLPGVGRHRLHPPSICGCYGAAAAASRLLGLDADGIASALAISLQLAPVGPFETFTKGGPVKDLYGGWPAFIGVQAAYFAEAGLHGQRNILEKPGDGIGAFLLDGAPDTSQFAPDPLELLEVQFKTYSTCRSVQPTLTALERLPGGLPAAGDVVSIHVETYPYAVGLSDDSDPATAIGARTSLPYCVASMLLDREVYPNSFLPEALADERRRALAARVTTSIATDMVKPLVRGARVVAHMTDGSERRADVMATRWSGSDPASDDDLREKFRRLTGAAAPSLEAAVDVLPQAADLSALIAALRVPA